MSFKPSGVRVNNAFQRPAQQNNGDRHPVTRLFEVLSYDVPASAMLVKDVRTGREVEITIDPARLEKIKPRADEPGRWVGYRIDENMAAKVKPGQRVVLQGVIYQSPKKVGDRQLSRATAQWVNLPSDSRPTKTFYSITTIEAYKDRVNNAQDWGEPGVRALDIEANREELMAYLAKMDESSKAFGTDSNTYNYGLMLSALIDTGKTNEDGTKEYECIDATGAFSWIQAERDEQGNKIKDGYPMDQERATGLIRDYLEYLNQTIPADKPYRVEVMPFRELRASKQSQKMVIHEKSPLFTLAHTRTRCSIGDQETLEGKNFAQVCILSLSKDQAPSAPGEEWKRRDFVQEIYPSGYRSHVRNQVRAFDGGTVKVHPELDRVLTQGDAYGKAAPAPSNNAPSQSHSAAPVDSGFGESQDDGFAELGGNSAEEDVFASVLNQTPSAQEQAPSAPQEEAAEKTSGGPNPGLFGGTSRRV